MNRRPQQVETRGILLMEVLRHDSFAEGYISAAQGRPFDADHGGQGRDAWFYERGRASATAARAKLGRCPPLWVDTELGSAINPQVISIAGATLAGQSFL